MNSTLQPKSSRTPRAAAEAKDAPPLMPGHGRTSPSVTSDMIDRKGKSAIPARRINQAGTRPRSPLYNLRWKRERLEHLRAHPWCVMCEQQGHRTPATVVDHIKPHRGDETLFWDRSNWQSLCKCHHDGAKQRQERSGSLRGCDVNGLPLDPEHHWNRQA